MFEFIANLSESAAFSSKSSLRKYSEKELCEIVFLFIVTLRILLWCEDTKEWARNYCKKTTRASDFKTWRTDATDLYAAMYGLVVDKEDHSFSPKLVWNWLHKASTGHLSAFDSREFFVKLDSYFHIRNESMKAVRRLAMDFYRLNRTEEKLCITRLLQLLRHRVPKSELLAQLKELADSRNYEIEGAYDKEASILKDLHKKVSENASAGATSAASVASVAGGLGAGFDDDFSKSIYGKKKEKLPLIIKR
jgi:hypothetical protein